MKVVTYIFKSIVILSFGLYLNSCEKIIGPSLSYSDYFEKFDFSFVNNNYTEVDSNSYYKSLGSGWKVYVEDI